MMSRWWLFVMCLSTRPVQAQVCEAGAWRDVGIAGLHCVGGRCGVRDAMLEVDVEPRVTAARSGSRIRVGDVLVAVEGHPITTAQGARALSGLRPGDSARVTVRRADTLVTLTVSTHEGCAPLQLSTGVTRRSTAPVSEVSLDGTRRIDLTRPRETVLGVDASLGLVLRCPTCEPAMSGDQVRWRTIEAPIVDQVLPGSVADEAGLRAGDAIVEVAGTDIRRETGLRRLLDYPLRDFAITWQRGSDIHRGTMNLRIVSRRVTRVAPEVVVAARDEPRGFGATLGKWWRALTGR